MPTITTHWRKQLRNSDRPAYLLLADLIADDIKTGRLGVRDRLPTLRELAADLDPVSYTHLTLPTILRV